MYIRFSCGLHRGIGPFKPPWSQLDLTCLGVSLADSACRLKGGKIGLEAITHERISRLWPNLVCACARAHLQMCPPPPFVSRERLNGLHWNWVAVRDPLARCFQNLRVGYNCTCARSYPFLLSWEWLDGLFWNFEVIIGFTSSTFYTYYKLLDVFFSEIWYVGDALTMFFTHFMVLGSICTRGCVAGRT